VTVTDWNTGERYVAARDACGANCYCAAKVWAL